MNSFVKNNYLNLVIAFCVVVLFFVVLSFDRKIAIDGDARDYYSYLVSLFIDNNFTHQSGNDWYLIETPTGTINVHTIGVAILIAPFFFAALLFSKIFGFAVDGFSLPFQMGVYFAGIFYCTVGLIFIKKLLLQLNVKANYVVALLFLTCFGTHLFSYTVNEPGMPHVYAFALTCAFFYFVLNLFQKRKTKYYYLSAFILGLIILVRPVNVVLLLFVPFFFQNKYDLISTVKVILRSKNFYLSTVVLCLVCSIQSVAWYNQNGKLIQDSYAGNGFYFNDPSVFKMLFGFNNGLFIYVPLCLLWLFGLIPMFNINRYKGFVFVFSLAIIFYIFGSYWAYNYFDGFGIRTFVDFVPMFLIAGAYMFQNFTPKLKYTAGALAFLFLCLNLLYIYQYRNGIIKGNGMNFDKYAYVFLKTNKAYGDSLGGANDLPLYSKKGSELLFESKNAKQPNVVFDSIYNFKDIEYAAGCNVDIKRKSNNFYVVAEFERKEVSRNSSYNALFNIVGSDPANKEKIYEAFRLNEIPSTDCCEWKKCTLAMGVTGKFEQNDKLSFFIWNKSKEAFFIKNLNVKIFDYSYNI
ncbi:MAG: glycosyltransferase family 39 protein [Bacteroidia bacterium]|nr:glycosyltransferase family 39 protein [Bacteroidia bacterium]